MIINHNIPAMNTYRQLGINQNEMQASMEKLSSGLRINKAGDDAAGLAISEKMRGQIRGLDQASRNAQDGISMIQTAEGALDETHSILQRMRELSVQSANDTNVEVDRAELQKEVNQLAEEITRIADTTEFNTQKLVDGKFEGKFHIGANTGQDISLSIDDMSADALGVAGGNAGLQMEDHNGTTTAVDLSGLAAEAGGEYAITKLDDTTTVAAADLPAGADVEMGYVMKNGEGEIVGGLDEDGQNLFFVADGAEAENIGDVSWSSASTVDFGDGTAVTNGTISISDSPADSTDVADGEITASQAVAAFDDEATTISTGEYTIVSGDDYQGVAAGEYGMVNSKGDVVAYNGDGTGDWTNRAGETLFSTPDLSSNVGETFEVVGEGGIDISTQEAANNAIETINDSIETVSAQRSELGAYQNRLEHTISNLDNSSENLSAAESRVRDVDMAAEMMEMTRANILSQASQSMLAQANQQPQSVLQLLQ